MVSGDYIVGMLQQHCSAQACVAIVDVRYCTETFTDSTYAQSVVYLSIVVCDASWLKQEAVLNCTFVVLKVCRATDSQKEDAALEILKGKCLIHIVARSYGLVLNFLGVLSMILARYRYYYMFGFGVETFPLDFILIFIGAYCFLGILDCLRCLDSDWNFVSVDL